MNTLLSGFVGSWPQSDTLSFSAGYHSRDAEVAELKRKLEFQPMSEDAKTKTMVLLKIGETVVPAYWDSITCYPKKVDGVWVYENGAWINALTDEPIQTNPDAWKEVVE